MLYSTIVCFRLQCTRIQSVGTSDSDQDCVIISTAAASEEEGSEDEVERMDEGKEWVDY